jgi:hypothetical protein
MSAAYKMLHPPRKLRKVNIEFVDGVRPPPFSPPPSPTRNRPGMLESVTAQLNWQLRALWEDALAASRAHIQNGGDDSWRA